MSEQEPVLSCGARREGDKCRLPAAVTFLIGPGSTPLPRCSIHAQSLREAPWRNVKVESGLTTRRS